MSGSLHITPVAGVAATGTVTIVRYDQLTLAEFTINGLALVEGTEWNRGASNAAAATSLATAISTYPATSAVATDAVITITATSTGVGGNALTMERLGGNDDNWTQSGPTLEGGTDTNLSDADFVAMLRKSVMFWKDKVLAAPENLK